MVMQVDTLARPKQFLIGTFVIWATAIVTMYASASVEQSNGEPSLLLMISILTGAVAGLAYLVSLGNIASRLNKSPIVWVGLAIIFGPFGAIGTFMAMLSAVNSAQAVGGPPPKL